MGRDTGREPAVTVDGEQVRVALGAQRARVPLEAVEGRSLATGDGIRLAAVHLPAGTIAADDVPSRWRDLVPRDDVVICEPAQIVGAERLGIDLAPGDATLRSADEAYHEASLRHLFRARPGEVVGIPPWSVTGPLIALGIVGLWLALTQGRWAWLLAPPAVAGVLWLHRWRLTPQGATASRLRRIPPEGRIGLAWKSGMNLRVSRGQGGAAVVHCRGTPLGIGALRLTRPVAALVAAQRAGVLPDDVRVSFETLKVSGHKREQQLDEVGIRWIEYRSTLRHGTRAVACSPLLVDHPLNAAPEATDEEGG